MVKISVVIITFNEEEHLPKCLDSVKDIADEILVLDSFSTDRTKEICLKAGIRFEEHAFDGYVSQKNRALEMASHDLILSLDGDEALSPIAISKVLELKALPAADGFIFNRRNYYCGQWMRHTSLYPDRKLRLFDRRKAHWVGYDPHDRVKMSKDSEIQKLEADILHWVIANKDDHLKKLENFSSLAAQAYFKEKRRSHSLDKYLHSFWRLQSEYILKGGFLAGSIGWQFSLLSAKYVYLKYQKLSRLYAGRS